MIETTDNAALGFFYVTHDERHADAINTRVDSTGDFADGILTSRVSIAKIDLVLVFVISTDPDIRELRYAAIATPSPQGSATGKKGARLSHLVELSIPLEELLKNIIVEYKDELNILLKRDAARPSPECWNAVWNTLKLLRPEAKESLERLENIRNAPTFNFSEKRADLLYCQKDAVSVALDIAGIKRNGVFADLSNGLASGKPLLKSVTSSLKEKVVVQHDVKYVPKFLRKYDLDDYCHFEKGSRALTVYNVDSNDGEIALGCDLIYHNHFFNSFTFVQYKLMDYEKRNAVYRPDSQFDEEVKRMKFFLSHLNKQTRDNSKLQNYRLINNPFYLKLCRRQRLLIDLPELTRGMYLNLDYWDRLATDPRSKGPRGGRKITFHSAERWLCRTEFTALVSDGWTGTYDVSEDALDMWITDAIKQHKSIIYARSSGERKVRQP